MSCSTFFLWFQRDYSPAAACRHLIPPVCSPSCMQQRISTSETHTVVTIFPRVVLQACYCLSSFIYTYTFEASRLPSVLIMFEVSSAHNRTTCPHFALYLPVQSTTSSLHHGSPCVSLIFPSLELALPGWLKTLILPSRREVWTTFSNINTILSMSKFLLKFKYIRSWKDFILHHY